MEKTLLIDGDSIAYMAGIGETEEDARRIVDEYMRRITSKTWSGRYELYIEADKNKNIFRNHVATTKPYKGNRKDCQRPTHLRTAKNYMVACWGAKVQFYLESEDMVAIRAYEYGLENVIIASIDKDMLQIPTEFYNYNKDEQFIMMEYQSDTHFWTQVLTGDATDNIPGLKGVGPKTANQIIFNLGTMHIDFVDESLCRHVVKEYIKRGHPYQYFLEQCRLLRMLRTRDDVYVPPTTKEEYERLQKELTVKSK